MIGGIHFPHNGQRFIIFKFSYGPDTLKSKVVQPQIFHRLTLHDSYSNQQTLFFNIVRRALCPKRRHYSATWNFQRSNILTSIHRMLNLSTQKIDWKSWWDSNPHKLTSIRSYIVNWRVSPCLQLWVLTARYAIRYNFFNLNWCVRWDLNPRLTA